MVLIYVRVSTDEQEQNGRSIDSQIGELTSIVEDEPDTELYVEPIADRGESGTDFDREGIQRVAQLAQHKEVTHLLVDTIDRIGRSVAETLMFIHELRDKFDVKLMTRNEELDVVKPTERMQVTMLATMADFGTLNRARSSLRSSADNFINEQQWYSWYRSVPFGYEEDDEWIQPIDELRPVVRDIFDVFLTTESYAETAEEISRRHRETLAEYEWPKENSLTGQQVKQIVTRPVYIGEPTIPVTSFEHLDPNPSVDDPDLQIVDDDIFEEATIITEEIAETYSTDDDLLTSADEYADEFDPHLIESVSEAVRLICPNCTADLVADGHQKRLAGDRGARVYECTNADCGHKRKWPQESELEMMQMLDRFDELHSLL